MRPRIGLALSSGGARGFAHLGVLKVLKEEGIPIDAVAGSSMGALVAVLLASGRDLDWCRELAIHLPRKTWLDFAVPRRGFITGDRVRELVRLLTHGKRLEEMELPVAVVATDLVRGERVVFTEGPAADAVRASISIPGVFEPVMAGDRVLVDGGVIDRVPVEAVRALGADLVVAVDVIPRKEKVKIDTVFDVIFQSLAVIENEISRHRMPSMDFLFHPDVADISPTAFTRVEECIRRGEEEARAQVGRLKKLMEDWRKEEWKDGIHLAE